MSFFSSRGLIASLASLSVLSSTVAAQANNPYILDTDYSGATFFDGFDFFQDRDPTNGFVVYGISSIRGYGMFC
jgi:hypothetical protein